MGEERKCKRKKVEVRHGGVKDTDEQKPASAKPKKLKTDKQDGGAQ